MLCVRALPWVARAEHLGHALSDFSDVEFGMICFSWRTGVKLAWEVHRRCRTYLVQQVLAPGVTLLRVSLLLGYPDNSQP